MPTLHDVGVTSLRWLAGVVAGTLLALILAIAEYRLGRARRWSPAGATLRTGRDLLRALPVVALVPIIQQIGVQERWKIALIAWAVMFPIWVSVAQALTDEMIDTELALTGARLGRRGLLVSYQLPKALAGLFRGVEIAIGVGWICVVAAEWVGTYLTGFWAGGLGFRIEMAHSANNWVGMFACLALFGLLGAVTAAAWRVVMKHPIGRYHLLRGPLS
jgi:ABC-type nitrate/sulfonate/bicarbonate transport system permease component